MGGPKREARDPLVPPELDAMCLRLQARKPENGCAGAAGVAQALNRFLESWPA